MYYKFLHESGVIVSDRDNILGLFDGDSVSVKFPFDLIKDLHRLNPGTVKTIAHTHPMGVGRPSQDDFAMIKGYAMALAPFPIKMTVFYLQNPRSISSISYLAQYETKEMWKDNPNKEAKRKVRIFKLSENNGYSVYRDDNSDFWTDILLRRSYERVEEEGQDDPRGISSWGRGNIATYP